MTDQLDTSWNNRYLNKDTGWDIGYPSTPIARYIDRLENPYLRILIPGCGNGYEGEYVWESGFDDVYLLDWAEQSKQNFLERVPDFPKEQFFVGDFFEHQGEYDLIIEQTFFCAMDKSLRSAYAEKMFELLAPGGKLVGVMFNDPLYEDHPPYGGSVLEYLGYFQPVFSEVNIKACYNSIEPRAGSEVFIKLSK